MSFGHALKKEIKVATANGKTHQESDSPGDCENLEGLVHRINFDDGHKSALQVGRNVGKQARLTQFFVDADVHIFESEIVVARTDKRFDRVGEIGNDIDLHRGRTGPGPESASGIGNLGARNLSNEPAPAFLQKNFPGRKMFDRFNTAVADDHVGALIEDRLNQFGDIVGVVLIVGIGVHDDVRSQLQSPVQSCHKGFGQSLVRSQLQDMIDLMLFGNFYRAIGTAVVHNEGFDDINAVDFLGQFPQGQRKRFFFVETGNLYDELHDSGWLRSINPLVDAYSIRIFGRFMFSDLNIIRIIVAHF